MSIPLRLVPAAMSLRITLAAVLNCLYLRSEKVATPSSYCVHSVSHASAEISPECAVVSKVFRDFTLLMCVVFSVSQVKNLSSFLLAYIVF